MRDLIDSTEFWVAMTVVAILKLRTSPRLGWWGRVLTVVTSVGCALIFTSPTVAYFGLDSETYTIAVAALWALTGEHLTRQVLGLTIEDVIRFWRGKR